MLDFTDICPNKEEYFVDENSAMPRACTIGQFVTCPSGYSCQAVHDGMLGYCCKVVVRIVLTMQSINFIFYRF